jgi:hypothetical protein
MTERLMCRKASCSRNQRHHLNCFRLFSPSNQVTLCAAMRKFTVNVRQVAQFTNYCGRTAPTSVYSSAHIRESKFIAFSGIPTKGATGTINPSVPSLPVTGGNIGHCELIALSYQLRFYSNAKLRWNAGWNGRAGGTVAATLALQ